MLTGIFRHADGAASERTIRNAGVYIGGFGQKYKGEDQDWSFSQLTKPEDASVVCSITKHLPEIARELDIKEFLVPSPKDFNAKICQPEDLTVSIEIGRATGWPVMLKRGVRADGLLLQPGQTYAVSQAGCDVVVAYHEPTSQLGVVHAGRKSVIDEDHHLRNKPPRQYESSVEALLHAMGCAEKEKAAELSVVTLFPIDPEKLTYPWGDREFGPLNRARSKFVLNTYGKIGVPGCEDQDRWVEGRIDVDQIIRAQLIRLGVKPESIETVLPPLSWYDTRGAYPDRRNLIIVHRE